MIPSSLRCTIGCNWRRSNTIRLFVMNLSRSIQTGWILIYLIRTDSTPIHLSLIHWSRWTCSNDSNQSLIRSMSDCLSKRAHSVKSIGLSR
jgi:hypothetical protein